MIRRVTEVKSTGDWSRKEAVGSVTLPFDERHRRRIRMADDSGVPFLLDLPSAVRLCDGDGLAVEGDGYILVRAAVEPVVDIFCETQAEAARVAWHIGNRHAPIEVLEDGSLRIMDDHVLVRMVEGLGARVIHRRTTFTPEPGAYAGGEHGHAHSHGA